MKKHLFLLTGLLLINCCSKIQAQAFSINQKKDSTVIEVSFPLKAYTYNQFAITDSSIIVSSPTGELDVIVADFTRDKRYYLNFITPQQYIFAKSQELEICDKASIGIDLSQTTKQHILYLPNNTTWIYHQSLGEEITTYDRIISDSIVLDPRLYHILQATTDQPKEYPISIQLKQNDYLVENKEIKLTYNKANIKFTCTLEEIKNQSYSQEIYYSIESSKPLLPDQ